MVFDDFPFWLRFAHFINIIFITLLIRSGIEILSALPKLYFNDHAKPGSEWIKFTKKKLPKDRLWISLDEEESFSSWVALPGHKNLGLGRHWHFSSIIFWIANGAAYYILLFTSDEWQTSNSNFLEYFSTIFPYSYDVCEFSLSTSWKPLQSNTTTFILWSCFYAWSFYDCYWCSYVASNRC